MIFHAHKGNYFHWLSISKLTLLHYYNFPIRLCCCSNFAYFMIVKRNLIYNLQQQHQNYIIFVLMQYQSFSFLLIRHVLRQTIFTRYSHCGPAKQYIMCTTEKMHMKTNDYHSFQLITPPYLKKHICNDYKQYLQKIITYIHIVQAN